MPIKVAKEAWARWATTIQKLCEDFEFPAETREALSGYFSLFQGDGSTFRLETTSWKMVLDVIRARDDITDIVAITLASKLDSDSSKRGGWIVTARCPNHALPQDPSQQPPAMNPADMSDLFWYKIEEGGKVSAHCCKQECEGPYRPHSWKAFDAVRKTIVIKTLEHEVIKLQSVDKPDNSKEIERSWLDAQLAIAARGAEDLQAQITKAVREKEELLIQLTKSAGGRGQLQAQLAKALREKDELQTQLTKAAGGKAELQVQLAKAVGGKIELNTQLTKAVREKEELQLRLDDMDHAYKTASAETQYSQSTIQAENRDLVNYLSRADARISVLEFEVSDIAAQKRYAQQLLEKNRTEVRRLQGAHEESLEDLRVTKEREASLQANLDETLRVISELRARPSSYAPYARKKQSQPPTACRQSRKIETIDLTELPVKSESPKRDSSNGQEKKSEHSAVGQSSSSKKSLRKGKRSLEPAATDYEDETATPCKKRSKNRGHGSKIKTEPEV